MCLSVSKVMNKHLRQRKFLLEAWRTFYREAALRLPESIMMHLLFCCCLGKRDDLVNSAVPFQVSKFFSTPLSCSLQGSIASRKQRTLFFRKSGWYSGNKKVCAFSLFRVIDRQNTGNWFLHLLQVEKQGRKMLGSWLRSSACIKMQVENLKNVLKWLLKLMQDLQGTFSNAVVT